MKIAFFLDKEKHPYEGVVRPFINWAKELFKNGWEVHFLLLNCEKRLTEFIENIDGIKYKNSKNFKEIVNYINIVRPNIILTDDTFRRLNLLTKIKNKTHIKTGVYIQVLFGTHSIVDVFNLKYLSKKEKILFKLLKIIPFSLLKTIYKKLLQSQDVIIANSKITATFLHTLYGIEPHGIVYPPVDTEIFRPRGVRKGNQVLLYLGSHAGDTDENFVSKICEVLKHKGLRILTMGNIKMAERLSRNYEIEHIHNISDEELAKIYSECILTICPQEWEQFGYVVAESVACGTPVLAFNIMGPMEIIEQTGMGFLANNKQEFINGLKNIDILINKAINKNNNIDNTNKFLFSGKKSTDDLITLLNSVSDLGGGSK